MRPTDVCHPFELRAPASRAFPASCRDFRRVDTPRSLRLRAVVPGDRMVHATRTASADCPSHYTNAVRVRAFLVRSASRLSGHERGRFLPTARGPIEPLTSLSPLPVHHAVHVTFVRALRAPSCWADVRSVVMGDWPRLFSAPNRDERCFPQPETPSLGKDPS
jgi:hypothetical protein